MIIGLGETVYDIIFKDNQPVKAVPGGSAFNAMISLGRSNADCMMVTEVGDDHIGDMIVQFLKDNKVKTDYVYQHPNTKSHISLAFLNELNDAQYLFYKDHKAIQMPDRIPEIKRNDIVLFGSYFAINPVIRDYVRHFLTTAKENGAILYYDINFRASHKDEIPELIANIEENMQLATVLRGSAEDFNILHGTTTGDEAYERVKSLFSIFVYTDAANPIQVFTPQDKWSFPVPQIKTVSTIGAGDNFNAGFCYALNNEWKDRTSPFSFKECSPTLISHLIDSGQKFSTEVCQSIDNHIAKY
jgi:fructokinase